MKSRRDGEKLYRIKGDDVFNIHVEGRTHKWLNKYAPKDEKSYDEKIQFLIKEYSRFTSALNKFFPEKKGQSSPYRIKHFIYDYNTLKQREKIFEESLGFRKEAHVYRKGSKKPQIHIVIPKLVIDEEDYKTGLNDSVIEVDIRIPKSGTKLLGLYDWSHNDEI